MDYGFWRCETVFNPLWDFGWFDFTRFVVDLPPRTPSTARDVLRAFLRDPISRRSFCTSPDPWGAPGPRHGPYYVDKMMPDWYQPLAMEALEQRVSAILNDPDFTEPPSSAQIAPVTEWMERLRIRGDMVTVLEAPNQPGVRVEWNVWSIFHEFISFSPNLKEMTVGVFGYD